MVEKIGSTLSVNLGLSKHSHGLDLIMAKARGHHMLLNSAVDHLNESGLPIKAFFVPKIDFDFFKAQQLSFFMLGKWLKKQ
ncbi:MAG: hypothetical protein IJJ64_16170 [Butyrivibrio sp.]|nr:hypothetical protein [Butyrivibrio sp.]